MGVGTQRLNFAEFYRISADECLRSVLVSVGNQDMAQELVDEAFARAWASWRTVSLHPAPKAWVVCRRAQGWRSTRPCTRPSRSRSAWFIPARGLTLRTSTRAR